MIRPALRLPVAGTAPPLRLRDTLHPIQDRRAVNLRWLLATTAMSLAAATMLWQILHAAMRNEVRAAVPQFTATSQTPRTVAEATRGDRLVVRKAAGQPQPSPVKTSHMQSSGLGDRALTVLTAELDRMDSLPTTSPAQAAPPAGPALPLPNAILLGAGGAPSPQVSSYAAVARAPALEPVPQGVALNVTAVTRSRGEPPPRVDQVVAQKGDTLAQALSHAGLSAQDFNDLAAALGFNRFMGGETVVMEHAAAAAGGRPFMIRVQRPGGDEVAAALTDADHYAAIAPSDSEPVAVAATEAPDRPAADDSDIDENGGSGSLREALQELDGQGGTEQALTANILRVLGTSADLGADVGPEDRLAVLYSTASGDDPGDQELDFAALTRRGRSTRLYRFATPDDGSVDYYDEAGHSVMKFLLRKPVANGILGDGFGWRIHPVLHDRRFHEGVDYRAPYGSPIVAAGAGTVEKIGFETGYGKYIRVRHDLGYETTYAHVSSFARSMAVGRRVQQGDTVAYVGSTGYSTGNHLYYEVKINGRNVDPLTVRLAAGRILSGPSLAAFQARRARIDTLVKASLEQMAER